MRVCVVLDTNVFLVSIPPKTKKMLFNILKNILLYAKT